MPSPLLAPVQAQPAESSAAKPIPTFATDEHRVFDLWLGIRDVTAAGRGQSTNVNRVSREHGGYTGVSVSFYDTARKKWHQTWLGGSPSDRKAQRLMNAMMFVETCCRRR